MRNCENCNSFKTGLCPGGREGHSGELPFCDQWEPFGVQARADFNMYVHVLEKTCRKYEERLGILPVDSKIRSE